MRRSQRLAQFLLVCFGERGLEELELVCLQLRENLTIALELYKVELRDEPIRLCTHCGLIMLIMTRKPCRRLPLVFFC